ncbi:MAG: hypothetical protein VX910_09400 [Candidatus Latescibacterota bacterium]|nr:hypothetical protein [Candidatus Latescibacterota bacterium]
MAWLELMLSDVDETTKLYRIIDHLIHRIVNVVKKMIQVLRYQVHNYCGGSNILDFAASSQERS